MVNFILINVGLVALISLICCIAWYRIVDPSQAHLVVTPRGTFVVSSDNKVATNNKKTYFAIPDRVPFFGRSVRIMDVTIKEIVVNQETYEKDQARYGVKSSTKYRIIDVRSAAETFIDNNSLQEQLMEVIKSSVRAVTIQYDVVNARSKKKEMEEKIRVEMEDDLKQWGLSLVSFQLVDFQDTEESSIISDISKRREKEIESTTRQMNAEKEKTAIIKEAESDEKGKQRQIQRDQTIGEQEQLRDQKISEKQKEAKKKYYEVLEVEKVRTAEITKSEAEIKAKQEKEVAIIMANREKDAELIRKEQKKLEGEGDRLKAEEIAKGEAAPIKEMGEAEAKIIKLKGLAEAESKDKLQAALNKFTEGSIKALVAEKVVAKDEAIGIATAKALEKADVRVLSGGDQAGFDLSKMIESARVVDESSANSILNRMARPNDMGLTTLGLESIKDKNNTSKGKNNKK